jgi:hypothetical protein
VFEQVQADIVLTISIRCSEDVAIPSGRVPAQCG